MSREQVTVTYQEVLKPEFLVATNFAFSFAMLLTTSKLGLQLLSPCCSSALHTNAGKEIGAFFCSDCGQLTSYSSDQLFLYGVGESTAVETQQWLESCLMLTNGVLEAQVQATALTDFLLTATRTLRGHSHFLSATGAGRGTKEERRRELEAIARELSGPLFHR